MCGQTLNPKTSVPRTEGRRELGKGDTRRQGCWGGRGGLRLGLILGARPCQDLLPDTGPHSCVSAWNICRLSNPRECTQHRRESEKLTDAPWTTHVLPGATRNHPPPHHPPPSAVSSGPSGSQLTPQAGRDSVRLPVPLSGTPRTTRIISAWWRGLRTGSWAASLNHVHAL